MSTENTEQKSPSTTTSEQTQIHAPVDPIDERIEQFVRTAYEFRDAVRRGEVRPPSSSVQPGNAGQMSRSTRRR